MKTTIAASLVVAALVAGCGSSSPSSTTRTTAASGRAQIQACLKKQGVTLPQRPKGAPPAGGGGFFFGGGTGNAQRPSGFRSDPKVAAALRKCGVNLQVRRSGNPRNSARFKQALNKFVACMKRNGYALPKPNTSGRGPVFDASKVNRNDPKFKSAAAKCQTLLRFGPPPGATTPSQ